MALSPDSLLLALLVVSSTGWILFNFAAKALAWLVGLLLKADVEFQFAGIFHLKDITIHFTKGMLSSAVVGEVQLQLLHPFAWLGIHYGAEEPNLQLFIYDVEIFVHKPRKSPRRSSSSPKTRDPSKKSAPFKRWSILSKIARYCSVTLSELVVKSVEIPNVSLEIKDMDLDTFGPENSSTNALGIRLSVNPINMHVRDLQFGNEVLDFIYKQQPTMGVNRPSILFGLERISVSSTFEYVQDTGLILQLVDVSCGAAEVNLSEELLFGETGLIAKLSQKKQFDGGEQSRIDVLPERLAGNRRGPLQEKPREKVGKISAIVPEKIVFTLPSLTLNFSQKDGGPIMKNKLRGLSVRTCVSKSSNEAGELCALWDMLFECGEICLLEENEWNLFQILSVSVVVTVETRTMANWHPRVKIDATLKGTRCHLVFETVDNLLNFFLRLPKKTARSGSGRVEPVPAVVKKKSRSKICWVCTVSVPEVVVAAYDSDGNTLHQIESQSLQVFVDNVSGPSSRIQLEVGKLEVSTVEEASDKLSSPRDRNPSRLIHLGSLVMEWGKSESQTEDEGKAVRRWSMLVVECCDTTIFLSAVQLQALLGVAVSVKGYAKNVLGQRPKCARKSDPSRSQKKNGGRIQIALAVHNFAVQFCGPEVVDEGDVPDPKSVNFGEQVGRVVITHTEEGALRTATIKATEVHNSCKGDAVCRARFEVDSALLSADNYKKNVQVFVNHGQITHEELDSLEVVSLKTTLLALDHCEVLCDGGQSGTGLPGRLLLSVASVEGHWNPDVHLFYHNVALQLSTLGGRWKGHLKEASTVDDGVHIASDKEETLLKSRAHKSNQKLRIAVDLGKIDVTAKVTEQVHFGLAVQSLVSDDVEIGFSVEKILLYFSKAQVLLVEQAQVCRLPWIPSMDATGLTPAAQESKDWKVSVHATMILITMPFRLPLRAIEDATEDLERVLKLVMSAQKSKWRSQNAVVSQSKKKQPSGEIKLIFVSVRELAFEIEEEPLQGWLDEHYHLMRREVCKLLVKERILEEKQQEEANKRKSDTQVTPGSQCIVDHSAGSHGNDSDWEKLQKEAFNSYRRACENLVLEGVSAASKGDLQSGFRVSMKRRSLLSVQASNVEINLTWITGSLTEAIRRLDCVSPDMQVPFSKIYARHLAFQSSALVVNLRDYSAPLASTGVLKGEGDVLVAAQAIAFPPQMRQEVQVGKLRTVEVWRSKSGETPAYKTFTNLSLETDAGEFSYGVGYEPAIADLSWAFSVALAKAKTAVVVVKKERSLPWWDDMRYYIHGNITFKIQNFKWSLLATTNPYEDQQILDLVAAKLDIAQSEGSVTLTAEDFKWVMLQHSSTSQSTPLADLPGNFCVLQSPGFKVEILMDWKCESGYPLNHYLHPFPQDPNPPEKRFDLYRSTSLSLTFAFSLFCFPSSNWNLGSSNSILKETPGATGGPVKTLPCQILGGFTTSQQTEMPHVSLQGLVPTLFFGSDELMWIFRLWNLLYIPPHKIRSFSRWPRFGIPRVPRSGNLSLDKVMTEYLLRVEATPGRIEHQSQLDGDPAQGLTFSMKRLRYELLYSRCQSHFDSTSAREPLAAVYQGLDITMLNAVLHSPTVPKRCDVVEEFDREDKVKELLGLHDGLMSESVNDSRTANGRGFLLSIDSLTLRKQAPKADLSQLSALLHYKRLSRSDKHLVYISETPGSGSDRTRSDASDEEGFSVVLADNCLRVSVYGLKLLWTLPNRDAVWSWAEDISRAFETPKPSPSRQSAQRKMMEMREKTPSETSQTLPLAVKEQSADTSDEEGVMHFMINVVQPQFNLHSEDASGRLLLAAASGRVLAQSFHSIVSVGVEIIAHALANQAVAATTQSGAPVIAWKRRELSVMLEHVQAHVAPTDVDLRAGIQWLPRIPTGHGPKVRRTGALLDRVFMPCSMFFRYTRHKGGSTDTKVKPLKELSFNSTEITATMTSSQFHIMVDVISNLLLARLPKPQKRSSVHQVAGEEEGEEEADEVVPEGVEEVEVARIKLEHAERECHAVMSHCGLLKRLGFGPESIEIQILEKDLALKRKTRRAASASLRAALQRAAHQRLMEKEKHRSPLAAMRISWAIDKFAWSMLCDGESFAEAEIESMILNVDRDFDDIGIARFTTKSFVVKNCLPGAKSSKILSPWNPPAGDEWGKNVMLRVDARQGAPKDGHSPLELFQVEIYPLRIHLTEPMYKMMWDYLFPEEDHDNVQRQTVRTQHQKVSLAVSTSGGSQGRSGSLMRMGDDKDMDQLMDEVSSKGPILPPTTSTRASVSLSVHTLAAEDTHSPPVGSTSTTESGKSREQKTKRGSKAGWMEDKKVAEEKKVTRTQRSLLEFHNIKICQVELLVTYEGSRFSVGEMRLLMDTFTRMEFTGSWRRLFSKVKKHIIWSVLKSVTGMQGKKFKDKLPAPILVEGGEGGDEDGNSSDSSTSQPGHEDQFPISRFRRHSDRAGEGFVSSIRGLFNSQPRKAKALVLRKLTTDLRASTESEGYRSGGDVDSSTNQEFGNINTKAKRLIQLHSRILRTGGSQKGVFGLQSPSSSSSSPVHVEGELSDDASSTFEDFHE